MHITHSYTGSNRTVALSRGTRQFIAGGVCHLGFMRPDTTEGKAKRSEAEGLRLTLNNNKFYIL